MWWWRRRRRWDWWRWRRRCGAHPLKQHAAEREGDGEVLRRARGGREAEVRRVEELHQLVARADGQIELLRCHGTRCVRHGRGWCTYGARTVAPRPRQAALSLGTHSVQEAGTQSPSVQHAGGSWEARVNTGHSLRSSVLSSFASASERMSFEASVLTTESCMPAALRKRRSSASVTVSMDRPPPLPPPPVLAVVVIRAPQCKF